MNKKSCHLILLIHALFLHGIMAKASHVVPVMPITLPFIVSEHNNEEIDDSATQEKKQKEIKRKSPFLDQTDNLHNYMMANYYQFAGRTRQAYDYYKTTFANEVPIYAYKGYIHLLFETQNYQHVEQLIPQLDALFKDDQGIQMIFAQVFERVGKHNQADERFIHLSNTFKSNQEIAFNTANSYLRRKEPENALQVIDNLLNTSPRKPNNFIFYFMKAQIQMQLNKKEDALASVQKSLEMHPRFDKGWLLFALLNEQVGELKDAIKGYSHFLEITGTNQEIEQHLLQLIFKQKIQQHDAKDSLVMNKKCFDGALELFDQKKYEQAIEHIDKCLQEKPDDDESKLLKIQILASLKQPENIVGLLKTWIVEKPDCPLWYKTLHLLTQQSITVQQAIGALKEIEKRAPQALLPALYLADLTTRAHLTKAALHYLEKALSLTSDTALKAKILYQIGAICYDEQYDQGMKKVVVQAQQLSTTYAPLLNLMAYYYASHQTTLPDAQKLMDTILKQDGANPHFLDTQAFIYYQQEQYPRALALLEKIAQKVPSDYTVLMHLAKTHHKMGHSKQAYTHLEKAKMYAKTTENKHECKQLLDQWKTKKI